MLLTSLAMGRTHPAWDAPPELPAGTMLTDIKRTMLRDLALMHQSQMPTSDSSTSPSRKDPTTSITINAVAARQIEVKREMCVIGRVHPLVALLGQRILGLALGYEDLNDHDELRRDRALSTAMGRVECARSDCAFGLRAAGRQKHARSPWISMLSTSCSWSCT